MTSMFDGDFDGSDVVYQVREAGKSLILAKLELDQRLGSFLDNANTEDEFFARIANVDEVISDVARRKMASVSDSKQKLAKSLFDDWKLSKNAGTHSRIDDEPMADHISNEHNIPAENYENGRISPLDTSSMLHDLEHSNNMTNHSHDGSDGLGKRWDKQVSKHWKDRN